MIDSAAAQISFMARETREAGLIVARQLSENRDAVRSFAQNLRERDPRIVVTIARGSSDHASLYLKYLIEILAGIPCASLGPSIASLYQAPLRLEGALAIAISQSGRSPDLVALQAAVRNGGALTLALVNDSNAPLAQSADWLLPLHAGPEKSVAATKSVIAAMTAGVALIAAWRENRALAEALESLPDALESANAPSAELVDAIAGAKSLFVLGRGSTYAIAAEAALKLKETCAIHAEAFSAAEVLHGPAGIISPGFPILAFMPQDAAREGMAETLAQLAAMGARVLMIDVESEKEAALAVAPADHPLLTPIAMLHSFYGLAESCSRALGRDPDNPPHLRKVTETR
jgi:glucosamine--fructose-6-phosphate aminotransferase (isomerizing)